VEVRRILLVGFAACAVHVVALAAVRARSTPSDVEAASREAAKAAKAALLARAEDDVRAGRLTLGEAILRLGQLDADPPNADPVRVDDDRVLGAYRALLTDVRGRVAAGEPLPQAIVHATDARPLKYKRMYPRLYDALEHGGGNCVAQSTLAAALAYDAGFPERAAVLTFANHVAPDVAGFHFGMAAQCHGPGVRVAAISLLAAYARARAKGSDDPFDLPISSDACDDPGDVFGDKQLVLDDPPIGTKKPPATPLDGADCRRRTPMDEYQDDVELLDADGRSLGGVAAPRPSSLDLAGHAASVSCFERRLDALGASPDPQALVLALGDAAMAAEEAARVFAEAGQIDVTREYEKRLAGFRARAAAPLEGVIRVLSENGDAGATVGGAGRLVALGEGGRTAMLLATEHHRGYWELANLMTRPSSQVGALARWSAEPPDVQLDAIGILPCASPSFRGQLASARVPAAATVDALCEVRSLADEKGACAKSDVEGGLARARARVLAKADGDLAEALYLKRRIAMCHAPELRALAETWRADKSEPIRKIFGG
jgi:hypothetical protein